jgi:hypothetical protein
MSTKNQHVDEIHTKMICKQRQDEMEKYKMLQIKEDTEFTKAVSTSHRKRRLIRLKSLSTIRK